MSLQAGRSRAGTKVFVILAIGGAVLFGGYIGYLAWSNDSFPIQEKPFGDYAAVASSSFNGTELAFEVKWLSAEYLPLYAQVTSPTSDAANTPVCGLGLQNVTEGQVIPMPFGISKPSSVLTNVDLSIAVRSVATGAEFTIAYHAGSLPAQQGNITPSNFSCRQPGSRS